MLDKELPKEIRQGLLAELIGENAAEAFMTFLHAYRELPSSKE